MPIETVRTIIKANNKTRQIDTGKVVAINFNGAGALRSEFDTHKNDAVIHVTQLNRDDWDAKADVSQLPTKCSQLEKDINFDERYYREEEIDAKFAAQNGEIVAIESDIDALQLVSHTHSNKAILDATQQAFTTALKSNYDTASTNTHTHTNKTTLDTVTTATFMPKVDINNALAGKEPLIASKLTAFNKNFGTTTGTVCQGNDSRLSDARTPTTHTHSESGISLSDVTTNDATTLKHGFLPKLDGDVNKFLNGLGVFSVPVGGGGGSTYWENLQGLPLDNVDLLALFSEYYNKVEIDGKGFALTSDIPTNFNTLYYQKNETLTTTEINNALDLKVDKVTGKSLSSNDFTNTLKTKLDGIADNANNYVLPATLEPTIINQNVNNRFVSDTQIGTWNAKSDFSGSYTDLNDKPTIPTALSELSKDINFDERYFTETETNNLLAAKRDLTLIGDLHGFDAPPNSGNFTLSNTGASATVTLLANAGSFKINGTHFTARELAITFTASLGQNFIYCGLNLGVPTLYATQTPWSILDLTIIPVATLNWDGTTAILSDELHLSNRNLIQHKKEHDTDGARWVSGFASTFASGSTNTFTTASGQLRDEERYHDIAAKTECMIGYRNSALTAMIFDAASTAFAKLTGSVPYYDNAGTLTALSTNQYGVSYIYATNRKLPTNSELACVLGQSQYSSVANAQSASQPVLSGMNVAEWKLLYRVIYRNLGGNFTFVQADDLRTVTTGLAVSGSGITSLTAVGVSFNPSGNIVATNVQSAIEEIDTMIGDVETILASI